jgi:signal peptidase
MKRRSVLRASFVGLLAALALGAGWLYLGPAQLGGSTSYAVIVGSSMEPRLHRGDLAIVREADAYGPGDAVLYESEQLGAKVLHRIRSVEGERFVLKGDNNDFLDSEQPLESQIVGELWLSVPHVGTVSAWVREPPHAALIVGLASLLALGGGAGFGRARRRHAGPAREREGSRASDGGPPDLQPLVAGIAALLALGALLALVSFSRSTTRVDTVPGAYAQQGRFDYSTAVARNVVYPEGRVRTGDPVFLRLVPRLRVAFDYELESRLDLAGGGQIGLVARLSDGRGWERRFELAPERSFSGQRASVAGSLDLRRVQTLIERLRDLTGSSQAAYSLTILPTVSVSGRVGGAPVETTFAPVLGFDVGDLRLQPDLEAAGGGVSPFAPREIGTGTRAVPDELSLGPLALPVRTARIFSLLALGTGLLLGLLVLGAFRRRYHGGESDRIAARFGHLLLPVTSRPQDWARITELADIESLVRLAEHYDRMILHLAERDAHSYVVEEGTGVYRYRTRPPESLPPIVEPRQPPPAPSRPPQAEEAPVAHWADRRSGRRRGRLRPASTGKAPRA